MAARPKRGLHTSTETRNKRMVSEDLLSMTQVEVQPEPIDREGQREMCGSINKKKDD